MSATGKHGQILNHTGNERGTYIVAAPLRRPGSGSLESEVRQLLFNGTIAINHQCIKVLEL
jgi:hypothetical protein